ncbi:Uncharacterised protein [Enterococcus durans]|uniref:hypothetical protein n=1 Tax=Enterococcus durans TaxID=53345 RepID=UPI000DFE0FEA|nr:hypothetical protein [Enterococcus durans]MDB1685851.1 hypothetical protein [Enterococcus durans]STP39495.1 Uncharacterised protein [Enterococcus durans]
MMNKREMRHSSPPNYVKSKIWNRFKIKILVSFGFLFALLLSLATPINSIEGSNTVEAATTETRVPFTVPETYTDGNVTIKFDVSGYLVDGCLSQTDDVKIVIYDPPVNPPAAQIWSANAVAGLPVGSAEKNGNNYTYTFTADRLISSDIFSQDGEMTVSLGATEFKISKDGAPITVKAPRIKINYVDTDGNPLDNPPALSEVSNADLQANSDDVFNGKAGRLDGQVTNITGYTFKLDQSTLTVPNAPAPDLKASTTANDGSLFEGIRNLINDAKYGSGHIKDGSVLTLVYQGLKPTAKIAIVPIDQRTARYGVGDTVFQYGGMYQNKITTQADLLKQIVQGVSYSDGIGRNLDYKNFTISGDVIKPDGSLDTSKKGTYEVAVTYNSDEIQKSVTVKTEITIEPTFHIKINWLSDTGKRVAGLYDHILLGEKTLDELDTIFGNTYNKQIQSKGATPYMVNNHNLASIENSTYEIKQDGKVVESDTGLTKFGSDWKTVISALEDATRQYDYSNVQTTEYTLTYVYVVPKTGVLKDFYFRLHESADFVDNFPGLTLSDGQVVDSPWLIFDSPIVYDDALVDTSKAGDFPVTARYKFGMIDITATATIHIFPVLVLRTHYVDENGKEIKDSDYQEDLDGRKLFFAPPDPVINGLIPSIKNSKLIKMVDGKYVTLDEAEFQKTNWSDVLTAINGEGLMPSKGTSSAYYDLNYVYVAQQTAVLTIDGQAEKPVIGEPGDEISFDKTDDQLVRGGYSYTVTGPDGTTYDSLAKALEANKTFDDSKLSSTNEDSHKQVFEVVYKKIPETGINLNNQSLIPLVVVSLAGLAFFVFRKLKRIK